MYVYSEKQAQVQFKALILNDTLTEIPAKYSNHSNVFLAENAVEFSENIGMNEHAIKLEENKQPPFESIYNLGLIELKILKTYIKTNLANGFI